MKVSYSLNGQKLDSDHMRVIVGSTHYTGLSPVVNTLQVKGRHGVVVDSLVPRLDAPELTLKVAAWGGDSDSRMARFRSLCLLTPGLTIGRTEETDDGLSRDMLTRAVCTSCEPDDEDERPFQDLRRMTAVFSLPDAFWRSDGYLRQEFALTGGRLLRGEIKLPSGGYWTRWAGEANNSESLMADFFTMWMGGAEQFAINPVRPTARRMAQRRSHRRHDHAVPRSHVAYRQGSGERHERHMVGHARKRQTMALYQRFGARRVDECERFRMVRRGYRRVHQPRLRGRMA